MSVAVAFMLASAVVEATQCSSGGESPSDGEPKNGVLLLQTKLQVIPDEAGALPECILHVGPPKMGSTSLQGMLRHHVVMLQSDGWHQPCYNASANADAHYEFELVNNFSESGHSKHQGPSLANLCELGSSKGAQQGEYCAVLGKSR